jgi:transcriptional regulator with XRE-family HTH domain
MEPEGSRPRDAFLVALGRVVCSHRSQLGQSRAELARSARISGLSVYRVEKGHCAVAVQVLRRVALALNLSLAALCAEAEELVPDVVIEDTAPVSDEGAPANDR